MVTLALSSSELEDAAHSLGSIAETLRHQNQDRFHVWNRLADRVAAAGFTAGFTALDKAGSPVGTTADSMSGVADILRETSHAAKVLERYLGYVESVADYSPAIGLALEEIGKLGLLLDFMCAREITALCTSATPGPIRSLSEFGDLPSGAIHHYNLLNAPPDIAHLMHENPDMRLLEVGDGAFVAAIGDIDTSPAVTILVPGVGSSDSASWPTQIDRARTVSHATGSASVLWMGYTAPRSLAHALSPTVAANAGRDVRDFHASLARRTPEQRRVTIGYSYGSTVVGRASKSSRGLDSDAVLLVGSPGAGVRRASDLTLNSNEPRVYAVTGAADPIGFAATAFGGVHGVDPTALTFGAQVWDSTVGHSDYWNDPVFLNNVKEVVKGQ